VSHIPLGHVGSFILAPVRDATLAQYDRWGCRSTDRSRLCQERPRVYCRACSCQNRGLEAIQQQTAPASRRGNYYRQRYLPRKSMQRVSTNDEFMDLSRTYPRRNDRLMCRQGRRGGVFSVSPYGATGVSSSWSIRSRGSELN
jgi:hypothetical protein